MNKKQYYDIVCQSGCCEEHHKEVDKIEERLSLDVAVTKLHQYAVGMVRFLVKKGFANIVVVNEDRRVVATTSETPLDWIVAVVEADKQDERTEDKELEVTC